MEEMKKQVKSLIKRAGDAPDGNEAMKLSQAAVNASNAMLNYATAQDLGELMGSQRLPKASPNSTPTSGKAG